MPPWFKANLNGLKRIYVSQYTYVPNTYTIWAQDVLAILIPARLFPGGCQCTAKCTGGKKALRMNSAAAFMNVIPDGYPRVVQYE